MWDHSEKELIIQKCWPSKKHVHPCTQYLVRAPFAQITASAWCGMEVICLRIIISMKSAGNGGWSGKISFTNIIAIAHSMMVFLKSQKLICSWGCLGSIKRDPLYPTLLIIYWSFDLMMYWLNFFHIHTTTYHNSCGP